MKPVECCNFRPLLPQMPQCRASCDDLPVGYMRTSEGGHVFFGCGSKKRTPWATLGPWMDGTFLEKTTLAVSTIPLTWLNWHGQQMTWSFHLYNSLVSTWSVTHHNPVCFQDHLKSKHSFLGIRFLFTTQTLLVSFHAS